MLETSLVKVARKGECTSVLAGLPSAKPPDRETSCKERTERGGCDLKVS
jgi:hypothetical protein